MEDEEAKLIVEEVWRFEEDVKDFQQIPNLTFFSEPEKCGRYLKTLGKLYISDESKSIQELNSCRGGISALRRTWSSKSDLNQDVTTRDDIITNLQTIQLVSNHLKDISFLFEPFMCYPRLISLNLSFNSLRDIPALSSCPQLRVLDISHNKLSGLEFLSDLQELTTLRFHHNGIDSLLPLHYHAKLEEVWASGNKLDFPQFLHLGNCTNLSILIKQGNPCDEKPKMNDYVQTILPGLKVLDGVVLSSSARPSDESVDVRVMITQARAQLKRDSTNQSPLSIDVSANGETPPVRSLTAIARSRKQGHPPTRERSAPRGHILSIEQSEDDSALSIEGEGSIVNNRSTNTQSQKRRQQISRHRADKRDDGQLVDSEPAEGRGDSIAMSPSNGLQIQANKMAIVSSPSQSSSQRSQDQKHSRQGQQANPTSQASIKTLNDIHQDLDHVLGDLQQMKDRER